MKRFTLIVTCLVGIVTVGIVKVNVFPTNHQQRIGDNIIFVSSPKSASEYIAKLLEDNLGYRQLKIATGYIPSDQIQERQIGDFFQQRHVITKQHTDASALNLQYIQRYTDRVVVNVRDPREILLSWVHHQNRMPQEFAYRIVPMPPRDYFTWTLEQQIDWNIEHFLPEIVAWIQDWETVKERGDLKVLFTTYNQLLENPEQLYNTILAFYDLPPAEGKLMMPLKQAKLNYRRGQLAEWRNVLSESQQQRIAQIVPVELLARFGW